ncbi:bifunctional ADP-dependent NAD(P)H-hydrate dehydratase/NAD(P)H-hydrate epimerase [Leptospira noguchii]|uniref:bifunctional ADP-dependent NAD(P)H-hydrate dehydratase/NAD(P)H-hydrate epimerase n=2 Tax=Leptospira noguchii TaxID=28182 RepID=UPI0002986460|nr:bifunctional ADP-dependent NAD(P)H-hydrate dehydratase/NAD(P)H-hydrate epimerase [Leptospira noguchii]EKR72135.1 YjeF family C-terminal domain protein [Leptospira noguchii str. 2006001870]UOG61162.1 bifunctional ADP-dependent NAD(P)H-hydrate dehydratase/NAD(P)H-hydrate epimerase [Leptospira noguchii]
MEIKFFEYSESLFDDKESRDLDRNTICSSGISGSHFMGFAAISVYQKFRKQILSFDRIQVLCGNGNNGGDGLALSFFLIQEGIKPTVYLKDGSLSEESKFYKDAFLNSGGNILPLEDFQIFSGNESLFLVDALLGTGFHFPLKSPFDLVISKIQKSKQNNPKNVFILSIDSVSGFQVDLPIPFEADALSEIGIKKWKNRFLPNKVRKTFHRIGFPVSKNFYFQHKDNSFQFTILNPVDSSFKSTPTETPDTLAPKNKTFSENQKDILSPLEISFESSQHEKLKAGTPKNDINNLESETQKSESKTSSPVLISNEILKPIQTGKILWNPIPFKILKKSLKRNEDSHKYKNGSLVVVGGSKGMSGAALSALLAFHELGGGISLLLTPYEKTVREVLKKDPSLMVDSIPDNDKFLSHSFVHKTSVLLLGPGLKSDECPKFVLPEEKFCVLDAGAIQAFANVVLHDKVLITPHTGELEILLNSKIKSIDQGISLAKEYTHNYNVNILWKRHSSFLIDTNGIVYLWEKPEPKLAVMGTGDLLAGILAFYFSRGFGVCNAVHLSFSLLTRAAQKSKGFPTASKIRKLLLQGGN